MNRPPLLGIIAPLPLEGVTLLGRQGWRRIDGHRCREGRLSDGTEVLAVCEAPGPELAAAAGRWLASRGAGALAVIGLAGGLDPRLRSGDLVLSGDILAGEHWRGTGESSFSPAERLWRGPLVSAPRAVLTAADKADLFRRTGALAVDLESAAAALAARRAELPFFALRAVCDPAGRTVPGEIAAILDGTGKVRPAVLAGALLRRPALMADLLALGRDFSAARKALSRNWRRVARERLPVGASPFSSNQADRQVPVRFG